MPADEKTGRMREAAPRLKLTPIPWVFGALVIVLAPSRAPDSDHAPCYCHARPIRSLGAYTPIWQSGVSSSGCFQLSRLVFASQNLFPCH